MFEPSIRREAGDSQTSERMLVTAISTNDLTVVRAWGASVGTVHTTGDEILLLGPFLRTIRKRNANCRTRVLISEREPLRHGCNRTSRRDRSIH